MIKRYRCKRKLGRVIPRHGRVRGDRVVELTDEEFEALGSAAADFEPIGEHAGDPEPLPEPEPAAEDDEEVTDG